MPRHRLFAIAFFLGASSTRADLVAHFSFDDDFSDMSGNANHLIVGSASPSITTTPGERAVGSGALDLNSTTANEEYLNLTTALNFGAGQAWSVAFWARNRPGSDTRTGMIAGDLGSRNFIWVPRDGAVDGLRFRNAAGSNADYNNGVQATGEYHHWAVVADGSGNIEVYYDSVSQGVRTVQTTFDITSVGQAFNNTVQSMDGQIDELRIYDEAISALAVNELFQESDIQDPGPVDPVDTVRVFLLAGQSNADGRGDPAGLPTGPVDLQSPQADVDFYEGASGPLRSLQPDSQFGPEITMGRAIADFRGDDVGSRIAILKYARGGTDLKNQWKGGGDATTSNDGPEYVTFQTTVTNGLAALAAAYPGASFHIEGVLWVQGERDARQGYHTEYEANLIDFIADVRLTYGAELPFIVVRLSSGQTNLPLANLEAVRVAQAAVAATIPRVELVDSDSFSLLSDELHFDANGQQQIGTVSAYALASYFPLGEVSLSLGTDGDSQIRLDGAMPGFRYTLQHNDSLDVDDWQDSETVTAGEASIVFGFNAQAELNRLFFRIIRAPPS